ncbi:hypothetical protein Plhal304r1_c007g0029271 [Plasmopara halstedii]
MRSCYRHRLAKSMRFTGTIAQDWIIYPGTGCSTDIRFTATFHLRKR